MPGGLYIGSLKNFPGIDLQGIRSAGFFDNKKIKKDIKKIQLSNKHVEKIPKDIFNQHKIQNVQKQRRCPTQI